MRTIEKRSLREEIIEKVKEYILKGHYAPGERIVIDSLAKNLGVSVTPVREALHYLAARGLLRVEPHKGFTVKKWDRREIEDLLLLRMYLEKLAVKLFIERAKEQDFVSLNQIIEKMQAASKTGSLEEMIKLNSQFHAAIVKGSGNEELCRMMAELGEKLYRVRVLSLSYPGRISQSCQEHMSIFRAVEQKDVQEAERRIEEHTQSVMNVLLKRVNEGLL
ncbi:GntR family transcriptional regulator [Pseudothermotoga sp. U03pept]|uniref:GntR family transcriptional regulator n=1 Tax=Pseudothermotoga sp. U03pept TaxID=3447012 RepID=UPI003F023B6D